MNSLEDDSLHQSVKIKNLEQHLHVQDLIFIYTRSFHGFQLQNSPFSACLLKLGSDRANIPKNFQHMVRGKRRKPGI